MKRNEKKFYKNKLVKVVFLLALVYGGFGNYNQFYLHYGYGNDTFWGEVFRFFLSRYAEYIAVILFGVVVVYFERNQYTRRRILTLMLFMLFLHIGAPFFLSIPEPSYGQNLPFQSTLPSPHAPGTMLFIVFALGAFLIGRRFDCGWNCQCVGFRETVGRPWRETTIKTGTAWKLRHIKWFFFSAMLVYLVLIFTPPTEFSARYFNTFWKTVVAIYFLSAIFIPLTGNRAVCRFICPFGSLYGWMQKISPFVRIRADKEKCVSCLNCEKECDMGIPINTLVHKVGQIKSVECMGCGRCIQICQKGVLRFEDVRDYLWALVRYVKNIFIWGEKRELKEVIGCKQESKDVTKEKKVKHDRLELSDIIFALTLSGTVTLAMIGLALLFQ
ncbi:MAG: 4Fe-4S binding protein [Nitrospinae bacterium]|nr:4Fe-4S binding protein [Nitrospinota bacterium]